MGFIEWFKNLVTFKKLPITPAVIQLAPKPIHSNMVMPQSGIDLIKSFEKCRLEAYLDSRGIPTIGWGHTAGVNLGDTCTQPQADAWLKFDLVWAWEAVTRNVKVSLLSYQYAALLSFVFNVGETEFKKSEVLQKVNAAQFSQVPAAFLEYVHITVDGVKKVSQGLTNRRRAEITLWNNNDWRVA